MPYLCPNCQNSINDIGERCQVCGAVFDPSQWPEEAYSLNGMIAHLIITWDNHSYDSSLGSFVIGRAFGDNVLTLNGNFVCNKHAEVRYENGEWIIEKIEGALFVNGVSVERSFLKTKDKIQIGAYVLNVSIYYCQSEIVYNENGILISPNEVDLSAERLYIGCDPNCPITISGADQYHSLVYCHNDSNEWWIVDNASSSGVRVNNERIRNKKLYPGDEITIVGVNFLYTGSKLFVGDSSSEGLSLSFKNVSVEIKKGIKILNDITFRVLPGEFVGILGPSGCGKSSLIQQIVGLSKFSAGEVHINGIEYSSLPDSYKDALAYLPQQNFLHDELTLLEEFECFKSLHKNCDTMDSKDSVHEVIRLLGLENEILKKVEKLSGGQQRRACIALELIRNPRLLVLDEPTSGLDPATEEEVMLYLKRISNQHKTVLCSTHIMDNINLFDKILVLSRGYLVFFGTPSELLSYFSVSRPLNLYRLFVSGTTDEQSQTAEDFSQRYFSSELFNKYNSVKPSSVEPLSAPRKKKTFDLLIGYWKRMFFELISFKNNGLFLKTIWGSSFFIQLILQPILVALVLKISCVYLMQVDDSRKQVFFFAAVAVFWFGLNNSVRELVKERIPWRCLERLELVPTSVYLFSKISWNLLICLIQVIVFSGFLFEFGAERFSIFNFPVKMSPSENPVALLFHWEIVVVLYIASVMGACIGLSVSSLFKKENSAVGLLPIILIPVIFFSQPIIQNDNYATDILADTNEETNGKYSKVAVAIEKIMPCHAPEVLMDLINNESARIESSGNELEEKRKTNSAWNVMLRNSCCWTIFAITSMFILQNRKEKKWEGR